MRVAVLGAGVGGLTFAAAVRRKAPAVELTLFERDESAFSRPQGYAIGLRNGFGLEALAGLGLRDQVIGRDALKVTEFAIVDQSGRRLLTLPSGEDGPTTTYRVQRLHLKEVLLQASETRRSGSASFAPASSVPRRAWSPGSPTAAWSRPTT
jgi:2-polyprenyl-6-methoxyphenol hydroxylase-like FAD-dependent oxidoreductase